MLFAVIASFMQTPSWAADDEDVQFEIEEEDDVSSAPTIIDTQFVSGTSDLPVPKGFALQEGSNSIFDSEDGKIVDAIYIGKGNREEVIGFYAASLPALGWNVIDEANFEREKEELHIEVTEDVFSSDLEISFAIRPIAD